MIVRAKRLGWNEQLSAEQTFDLEPYEQDNDDLIGELIESEIAATAEHPSIVVCLVGGQEADPATIERL